MAERIFYCEDHEGYLTIEWIRIKGKILPFCDKCMAVVDVVEANE